MGLAEYGTFSEVRARLDEILVEVRKKDLSLEKSLDLYEEAIKLGNRCAELVDKPDFTEEEARAAMEAIEGEAAEGENGDTDAAKAGDADGAEADDEAASADADNAEADGDAASVEVKDETADAAGDAAGEDAAAVETDGE